MAWLESVPNVSEGRDASAVAAIAEAFARAGARVLDTHVDDDHNRAVITLVGDDRAIEEGLVAGIDEARRRIDLRAHEGVHPRVGAADVVPVVPLVAADLARALGVARTVGARVGEELRLRRWARENYVPNDERDGTWHPIILEEMRRKDGEVSEAVLVG